MPPRAKDWLTARAPAQWACRISGFRMRPPSRLTAIARSYNVHHSTISRLCAKGGSSCNSIPWTGWRPRPAPATSPIRQSRNRAASCRLPSRLSAWRRSQAPPGHLGGRGIRAVRTAKSGPRMAGKRDARAARPGLWGRPGRLRCPMRRKKHLTPWLWCQARWACGKGAGHRHANARAGLPPAGTAAHLQ
jgi:hypothetical protein